LPQMEHLLQYSFGTHSLIAHSLIYWNACEPPHFMWFQSIKTCVRVSVKKSIVCTPIYNNKKNVKVSIWHL
jgi:hypothetical protein